MDTLKALGASIIPVNMPATPYALSAYYVIASAEASSNLARYDGIQYGECQCVSGVQTFAEVLAPPQA